MQERLTVEIDMPFLQQLFEDVRFLFRTTEANSADSKAHLVFAITYFYANRDILKEIGDALLELSEDVRKQCDPNPNDGTWKGRTVVEAVEDVTSSNVWLNFYFAPIGDDAINMLVRVLRIAVNAPIRLRHNRLLMSPAEDFYNALRGGGGWNLMTPEVRPSREAR